MDTLFIVADYANKNHANAVVTLLDDYARDPMGGGKPLDDFVKQNLVNAMSETPGAFSVLGFLHDKPVALANCFRTLSTFACQPLINIHDLAVVKSARGQGMSQKLLAHIEQLAREQNCCKITLEVLEGNKVARGAYVKSGFAPYTLDASTGQALFMHKVLP